MIVDFAMVYMCHGCNVRNKFENPWRGNVFIPLICRIRGFVRHFPQLGNVQFLRKIKVYSTVLLIKVHTIYILWVFKFISVGHLDTDSYGGQKTVYLYLYLHKIDTYIHTYVYCTYIYTTYYNEYIMFRLDYIRYNLS